MEPAKPGELGKMRIERDTFGNRVEGVRACPYQIDLACETFARPDHSGHPLGFDVAPNGIGKTLQDDIRCILKRNRAVEIDEHVEVRRPWPPQWSSVKNSFSGRFDGGS